MPQDLVTSINNFKRGAVNLYDRFNQPMSMPKRTDTSYADQEVRDANRGFQQKAEQQRAAQAATAAAAATSKRTPKRTVMRTAPRAASAARR